ncbi:MAG: M23 family metallopeptidase [Chloroflexota bacterium]|nr:M23 family metallopeptidase [Chloroflexota bacterium]
MTEAAEKPSIITEDPGGDEDSSTPGWVLHLTVLLAVLIALLWLSLIQPSSPVVSSTPMNSTVDAIAPELPSPSLEASSGPVCPMDRPENLTDPTLPPTEPSQSDQWAGETDWEFSPLLSTPTTVPQIGQRPRRPRLLTSRGGARPTSAPATFTLIQNPVPHTIIPDRPRLKVVTYTVQSGDTLLGIAQKFELDADTIMWASGRMEDHPDLLKVGQILTILPVDGVYHTVQEGDTLEGIAKKYKVDVEAIAQCKYNDLKEPYKLTPGQKLIVPGGEKPYTPRVVHVYTGKVPAEASKGTGVFGWPVSGVITQKFWARHKAIDIGAPTGTPIVAADSGYVAIAGWSNVGYGSYIVIDHGNGFQTLYAHLSAILVEVGQSVGKGERIGSVGSTGHSTGPHLHFEVRYRGVQRNPFGYLP